MVATFATACLSFLVPALTFVSALFMTWVIIAGHNYFHRRDNFRMRYFNLTFMNYREWRVSHALSHHLFTNSLVDMEVMWLEPLLCWLPNPLSKGLLNRYVSWAYGPFVYALFFVVDFLKRLIGTVTLGEMLFSISDAIPFALPAVMYTFVGDVSVAVVVQKWLTIVCLSSFMFAFTGLNAGHHHPDVFHDGDAVR